MTPEKLEYVAKAFYEVEHSTDWHSAASTLQEHYIGLAQTAVLLVSDAPPASPSARRTPVVKASTEIRLTAGSDA